MALCYGSPRKALIQRFTGIIRYLPGEENGGRVTPSQGTDYAKARRSERAKQREIGMSPRRWEWKVTC